MLYSLLFCVSSVTHCKNKDFYTEGEASFLSLARKFALKSTSCLLDQNQWAMKNSYHFACLQISVKFQIPLSKSVERQVLISS